MGRILNLLMQKILPSTKKSYQIRFMAGNEVWKEIFLPPSKKKFKVKGSDTVYYLKGTPGIDNDTNQRIWHFVKDVSSPINFHKEYPSLIEVEKNKGNMQMQLVEADQQGYERAMLIKGNKDQNWMLILILIVGINLVATLIFGMMIANKLGITFM